MREKILTSWQYNRLRKNLFLFLKYVFILFFMYKWCNNFSFILVSHLKWKWSIRTCVLKFFIDETMDNVCNMKRKKNVEYKKKCTSDTLNIFESTNTCVKVYLHVLLFSHCISKNEFFILSYAVFLILCHFECSHIGVFLCFKCCC